MTRIGRSECTVLLAFWLAGLAAFFLGGLSMVGSVLQVLLGVVVGWGLREVYRWGKREEVRDEFYRWQIYREWRANVRKKRSRA